MEAIDAEKQKEKKEVEPTEETKQFRLTFTHGDKRALEGVVSEIERRSKALKAEKDSSSSFKVSGPARMPTRWLTITTRKSPCGNGTATFDRFDMRIHKRVFHIRASQSSFQQLLAALPTQPGMLIEALEIAMD